MQSQGDNRLIWVMLLTGLGLFAALLALGLWQTGGVFVYPLDDPYIHLSMAEQIFAGGYGINPGEYASADSSLLFPVLLLPFTGTGFHAFMPLVLNGLGLGMALILLAKIIIESGFATQAKAGPFIIFVAVLVPLALNFYGLALLGMEHMLHVASVLMALLGLLRWLQSGRLNWLLVTGILLGPLLRYESLGLSLVLSTVLVFSGHKKAGFALALGAASPIIAFGFWLQSLGLSFLPNSVMAKAIVVGAGKSSTWAMLTQNFSSAGSRTYAILVTAVALTFLLMAALPAFKLSRNLRILAFVAGAMGLGHAILGKFGWANRYEIYALTFLAAVALVMAAPLFTSKGRAASLAKIAALLFLAAGISHYAKFTIISAMYGPVNIYSQQWQMAELARRFEHGPVLVNDIGLVSFQNEERIIDLFGLASIEALNARRNREAPGWPNRIAQREGAGMAMIYTHWLAPDFAPSWELIAHLDLEVPQPLLEPRVFIYATRPEMAAPIRALLEDYAPQLPRYAALKMVGTAPETQIEETR